MLPEVSVTVKQEVLLLVAAQILHCHVCLTTKLHSLVRETPYSNMIVYTILALGLPSLFYYLYSWLKKNRSMFLEMPALKRSFMFGNILQMEKYVKNDRHPGVCIMDPVMICSDIFGPFYKRHYYGTASSD